jgi:hypothetical protein
MAVPARYLPAQLWHAQALQRQGMIACVAWALMCVSASWMRGDTNVRGADRRRQSITQQRTLPRFMTTTSMLSNVDNVKLILELGIDPNAPAHGGDEENKLLCISWMVSLVIL